MVNTESGLTLPPHVDFSPRQDLPSIRIGESIADGRYQVQGILSRKACSEVYRATDWGSERGENPYVVVKILHEPYPSTRERVDTELATHLALNGEPGIVPVRDVGILERAGGQYHRYIATELASKGDLFNSADEKPRDIGMLVSMGLDILPALELMHENGIIHRDIKPENILSGHSGENEHWDLTDFGLVEATRSRRVRDIILKSLGAKALLEPRLKRSPGTKGYFAPEVLQPGDHITPKVDVFSIGVTIFKVATGELPFRSETIEDYSVAIVRESPVAARALNRSVPLRLDMLTRDCLRPDPRDRPTVGEILLEFQTL